MQRRHIKPRNSPTMAGKPRSVLASGRLKQPSSAKWEEVQQISLQLLSSIRSKAMNSRLTYMHTIPKNWFRCFNCNQRQAPINLSAISRWFSPFFFTLDPTATMDSTINTTERSQGLKSASSNPVSQRSGSPGESTQNLSSYQAGHRQYIGQDLSLQCSKQRSKISTTHQPVASQVSTVSINSLKPGTGERQRQPKFMVGNERIVTALFKPYWNCHSKLAMPCGCIVVAM